MEDENTIENQRLMDLERSRSTQNINQEKNQLTQDTEGTRYINGGEVAILLAFTGIVELIELALDFVIYIGWIINIVITLIVGGILMLWLFGKTIKGAPKSWYKIIYWGAVGGAIPIIPGYLGAIIYLLMLDRQLLGEVGTKIIGRIKK